MQLDKYYLNLDKINKIESLEERNRIHELYREMLFSDHESRTTMVNCYFNTLHINGYLIDIRDEKIEKLLDDSISS